MNYKLVKSLLDVAVGTKKTIPTDFELKLEDVDIESALRDQLKELATNYTQYCRNRYDIFDLLQESFDEVLPNKVSAIFSAFAEVQNYGQGDRPIFKVGPNKRRGKQFVTRVALSGVYETFRLDSTEFEVPTAAVGGAGIIDFERYLDGFESIMDLYDIILEGIVDHIYKLIQEALLASWNEAGRPAANKLTFSSFDPDAMQEVVNTVSAYGAPIIFCAPQFAAKMANFVSYASANPNMPQADLNDIREQGYIGKFRGTPIVVLPQSFEDETNSKFVVNPRVAYIIPAGRERIVKIAFEGQTVVRDHENRDNSMEIQAYRKVGVGIYGNPNYWAIVQNTGIVANGWSSLPAVGDAEAQKVHIVYNPGNGTGDDIVVTLNKGATYSIAANSFTGPTGLTTFNEWNTKVDGTGTGYDPADSYTANAGLVLYATWKV